MLGGHEEADKAVDPAACFIQLCAVQTEMVNENTAHGKHFLKSTNILQDVFTLKWSGVSGKSKKKEDFVE